MSRISKERLVELENIKVDDLLNKVEMLTRGDMQAEELARLRKQFESYVRQHYDI